MSGTLDSDSVVDKAETGIESAMPVSLLKMVAQGAGKMLIPAEVTGMPIRLINNRIYVALK